MVYLVHRGCESKVAGVRNRYMPLKELPSSEEEISEIAQQLYTQLVAREDVSH